MTKYALFEAWEHETHGGAMDCSGVFDTLHEAQCSADGGAAWCHIARTDDMDIVSHWSRSRECWVDGPPNGWVKD